MSSCSRSTAQSGSSLWRSAWDLDSLSLLRRPAETLKPLLLIGAAEHCAAVVRAYEEAGVERLFLWPLADEPRQLELFMKKVALHGA